MLKKIRFVISPYFLMRYYLLDDIKYFVKKYKFSGILLDIGCGQKPYDNLFCNSEYVGIDFREYSTSRDFLNKKPDYYFDEKYSNDFLLPFEKENFDNTVSFQVLEHHRKPELMISEMARITKKNGLILLSCPFIFGLHEEPRDFQRFTEYKLRELLELNNCEIVKIKKQGSLFSVISLLFNEQLDFFASRGRGYYFFAAVLYIPFLLFQYVSFFLDKLVRSDKIFINYIILAQKIG